MPSTGISAWLVNRVSMILLSARRNCRDITPYPKSTLLSSSLNIDYLSFLSGQPSSSQICTVVNGQGSDGGELEDSVVTMSDSTVVSALFGVGDSWC
jgi:hypothetical protein